MLSIYGTCAVLAGIAGRNKLLIKKEALTVMVSAFLLCATIEVMGLCEESAGSCVPEG